MSVSKWKTIIDIVESTKNWLEELPDHQVEALERQTGHPNPKAELERARQLAWQLSPKTRYGEVNHVHTHLVMDLLEGRFFSCTTEGFSDVDEGHECALEEAAKAFELSPEDDRIGVVVSIEGNPELLSVSAPNKDLILETAAVLMTSHQTSNGVKV
ncbi:hypothetical protein [Parasedimentitalea maritima]|uniref:Uncharacterized protein n=1 Tax=Parasedimentitalea maritima TaxID=2578117 RepID=A0A6A4R7Y3_9RHOB|nr:hypothetical protein [Zongyanglinia marina]KAE9627823.1 hypothetical protein GP644_17115 [Zongyanglinia marina]